MLARLTLAVALCTPALAQWSQHQLVPKRLFPTVDAVGDLVVIAGGRSGGVEFDRIDVLDLRTGAWTDYSLGVGRHGIPSVVLGDTLVYACSSDTPSPDWDVFDVSAGTVTSGTLPTARSWVATAGVNDKAIFAGGTIAPPAPLDAVDVYDATTRTWSSTTLANPRYAIAAATVGDLVLFAGGRRQAGESPRVDFYDDSTGTWSVGLLSEARYGAVGVTVAGQVLIAGGWSNPGAHSTTVDIYDAATDSWSVASLSEGRVSMMTAVVGDLALFAGGVRTDGSVTDAVDIYDARSGGWSTATLSTARQFTNYLDYQGRQAAVAGTRAFFMGGRGAGCVASARVDIFDAETGAWTTDTLSQARNGHPVAAASRVALVAGLRQCFLDTGRIDVFDATVGGPYCVAQPANSTGFAADLRLAGSDLAGGWPLTVRATHLPPGQFGLLLTSQVQAALPGASGTLGTLCLGFPIGRFIDGAGAATSLGVLDVAVDTQAMPLSGGVAVQPGDTWNFQLWYRDQGGVTNVSRAWSLTFQ